jgi:hypothetical protein
VGVDGDGPGSWSGGLALGEEAMVCELKSLERYFIRILSRNWKVDGELKLLSFVYQVYLPPAPRFLNNNQLSE